MSDDKPKRGLSLRWIQRKRPHWLRPPHGLDVKPGVATALFVDGVEHSGAFEGMHALAEAINVLHRVGATVRFYSVEHVYVDLNTDVDGERHNCRGVDNNIVGALTIAICHAYHAGLSIEDFQ